MEATEFNPQFDHGASEVAFLHEQQGFNARYANDDRLFVQFHVLPVIKQAESAEQGRPIYRDVVHVRIMQPGNKDSVVDRPVTEEDKRRFARQYAAWEQGEAEILEGTMLEAVARDPMIMISISQIEELKFFGIRTIEQLANVSDVNAQKFMGINELRKRAKLYLEAAKERSDSTRLHSELEKRDNQLAVQAQAIADLQEQVKALMPKQGRLSKEEEERRREVIAKNRAA